jgi:ribosomal protein L17
MAGSIIVRYAQKTYKQQRAEEQNSAVFKNLTHSVDIIPESISIMTFKTQKEASKFAEKIRDEGYHIIEIKDDYRKS